MKLFTHAEMQSIQDAREQHRTVASICQTFDSHTREEIVEALDSLVRTDTIAAAQRRVNHILVMQDSGEPLINGKPVAEVESFDKVYAYISQRRF